LKILYAEQLKAAIQPLKHPSRVLNDRVQLDALVHYSNILLFTQMIMMIIMIVVKMMVMMIIVCWW